MARSSFWLPLLLVVCGLAAFGEHGKGRPPGIAAGDTPVNHPLEPPVENRNKKIDLDQVKRESDELKKLADALPDEIQQVSASQMPENLPENSRHISKFARHLRGEISQWAAQF